MACDLMWKICTPFLASVNSRQKGEHPSGSRVNYVPAGGRNATPPRKAIVFNRQTRNKPLLNGDGNGVASHEDRERDGSRSPIQLPRLGRK
jgi:hypothetical protein